MHLTASQADDIAQRILTTRGGSLDRADLRAAAYDGAALMVPKAPVKTVHYMDLRPLVGELVMEWIADEGPWTWGEAPLTLVSRDAIIDWLGTQTTLTVAYDTVCRMVPMGVMLNVEA